MPSSRSFFFFALAFVGVLWSCVLCLQRPPPRYSQQYMPDTSFTCQNKILGSYYADPETDCQLFHVCVSVAGTVQDYRFLCPNGTAFDQESQTCADWYDVDCEAATLYYASDNFDLYRLGSGLESLHFDSLRSDAEPQDHLQRSETSDAVRSSANALNRVASTSFKDRGSKDILHGSSSSNYFNNRNNAKDDDYDDKVIPEPRKKSGVRKVSRKQQYDNTPTTTAATSPSSKSYNFYSGNNYNHQRTFDSSTTTPRAASTQEFKNTQKTVQQTTYRPTYSYSTYTTTTYRPSTNYPEGFTGFPIIPSTTAKTTTTNSNNKNNFNNAFGSSSGTTPRPSTYKKVYYDPSTLPESFSPSTTNQPSTNYQSSDFNTYNNNFQRNYNNIQRTSSTSNFPSSTNSPNFFDSFNSQFNSRSNSPSTIRQDYTQTTAKFISNNFSNNGNAPTTYSPITKKNENVRDRYNTQSKNEGQYNDGQYKKSDDTKYSQNNGQYYDKLSQSKSTNFYDSTKPPKKVTQYNNYDSGNNGKYYETTTTANYDFGRSGAIGFSPSSINHLAESPKTTTPVPRKTGAPTTYNPNSFNTNNHRSSQTNSRGTTHVSHSARPFSTTPSFTESTTLKATKTGKKNDYDYAYYDNAGALEYDGIELEHVTGNKESSKISRS
ncbi:probable serine/threonine-protein kinase DDB_G0282963 [Leptopilina boulardi]|uniref:probable serine/threonine-protein kinase DDB_G0282963 n=1 Tax=Leptopilina boulardi TaxID=63433 RepID=UPI0021F663E7|nr:probable serine/threonine-protein kinase DDB_G0282963 [Leptopilina boulardi]